MTACICLRFVMHIVWDLACIMDGKNTLQTFLWLSPRIALELTQRSFAPFKGVTDDCVTTKDSSRRRQRHSIPFSHPQTCRFRSIRSLAVQPISVKYNFDLPFFVGLSRVHKIFLQRPQSPRAKPNQISGEDEKRRKGAPSLMRRLANTEVHCMSKASRFCPVQQGDVKTEWKQETSLTQPNFQYFTLFMLHFSLPLF